MLSFGKRGSAADALGNGKANRNALRDHPEGHEGSSVDINSSLSRSLSDSEKSEKKDPPAQSNKSRRGTA